MGRHSQHGDEERSSEYLLFTAGETVGVKHRKVRTTTMSENLKIFDC